MHEVQFKFRAAINYELLPASRNYELQNTNNGQSTRVARYSYFVSRCAILASARARRTFPKGWLWGLPYLEGGYFRAGQEGYSRAPVERDVLCCNIQCFGLAGRSLSGQRAVVGGQCGGRWAGIRR